MGKLDNFFNIVLITALALVLLTVIVGVHSEVTNPEDEDKIMKELMEWEAPYYIRKGFPYSLVGFDDEGSPIWFAEIGRFDIRGIMENGTEAIEQFAKYVTQALHTIHYSTRRYSTPENPIEEFVAIGDCDGFNYHQFSHLPTLRRDLAIFQEYLQINLKFGYRLKAGYGVNANYFATQVWNLAKTLLGGLAQKFEIYGTNPSKWKSVLLKEIPRTALPDWLGGYANFTPIHIYG